jgi:GDP-4-dehydro-6-deoxy-D-mannose reductase
MDVARSRTNVEIAVAADDFDVRDTTSVLNLFAESKPDRVLHLAAQSSAAESLEQPIETYQVNVIGTANVVHAACASDFRGRLLFISSADVYGAVDAAALPITESQVPFPRNPYAASKLAAEAVCLEASRRNRFEVIVARPFNHLGPGQDSRFAIANFAAQLAAIASGDRPPILTVGDVSVERDFTDVRDVVRAYFRLLEQGSSGEIYNVCSGTGHRLEDVLQRLLRTSGVEVEIRVDESRLRGSEAPRMVGDNTKLKSLGWEPQIPLSQTLHDILERSSAARRRNS